MSGHREQRVAAAAPPRADPGGRGRRGRGLRADSRQRRPQGPARYCGGMVEVDRGVGRCRGVPSRRRAAFAGRCRSSLPLPAGPDQARKMAGRRSPRRSSRVHPHQPDPDPPGPLRLAASSASAASATRRLAVSEIRKISALRPDTHRPLRRRTSGRRSRPPRSRRQGFRSSPSSIATPASSATRSASCRCAKSAICPQSSRGGDRRRRPRPVPAEAAQDVADRSSSGREDHLQHSEQLLQGRPEVTVQPPAPTSTLYALYFYLA